MSLPIGKTPRLPLIAAAFAAMMGGNCNFASPDSGSKRHGNRRTTCAAQRRAARTRRNIRGRAPKRKAMRA